MDKKIEKLGKIDGKILVFGGVYSNLQALQALIQRAAKEGIPPENCFCTGDIVGYCAQPEETLQAFKNWGARSIIGNVEEQLRSGAIDCGCDFKSGSRCDSFSKEWYPYAQSQISEDAKHWMKTLPDHITFQYADRKVMLVHGSYDYISDFIFKSTPWTLKESSFTAQNADVIIAGHCGLPFTDQKGGHLWLNAGVIGMPANEGLTRVWYMILDDAEGLVHQHKTLVYDHILANDLMRKTGLPRAYADTLLTGLWDNMEILPEREKKLRGLDLYENNSL